LPIISDTLPIFDEICIRSLRFISSCLVSPYQLVLSVARHCVLYGRHRSILGRNALLCCDRFNWSIAHFIMNPAQFKFSSLSCYINNFSDNEVNIAAFLLELLAIRDGQLFLPNMFLSKSQIEDIIVTISTT
jgi:hypothetical protein